MGTHVFTGSLAPRGACIYYICGSGYYKPKHLVQLDAYPTSTRCKIKYFDFKCRLENNGLLKYYVTVLNESYNYPVTFKLRVWYQ